MLPRFTQHFLQDFNEILKADEPFAFSRFHDGEYALCQGVDYKAKSGWSVDGATWLRDELLEALHEGSLDGYYLGISPPCDYSEGAAYYRKEVKIPKERITFATVFQHSNFKLFPQILQRYKDPILVSCRKGDISVPSNGVRKRWKLDEVVDKLLLVEKRPIFVAAGPCANVIIHKYWTLQDPDRRCTILDVGSSLDRDIHGKDTRPFHDPKSPTLRHKCDWEEWKPYQPMTVQRREAALRKQFQAQVFREMREAGFTETQGYKGIKNQRVRTPIAGSTTMSVRDQPSPGPGGRNVRIRHTKKP